MTGSSFSLAFLGIALLGSLLASLSRSTERLLTGMVLVSLCLGVAVQMAGGGYYGIVMIIAFMVTDIMVYLYFRTLSLLPSNPPKKPRPDKLHRIFFLWAALFVAAVLGLMLFSEAGELLFAGTDEGGDSLALLHERIWGNDWILIFIPLMALFALVIGGFFLVRREK